MDKRLQDFQLITELIKSEYPFKNKKPHAVQYGKTTYIYFHQPYLIEYLQLDTKDLPIWSNWIAENCTYNDSFEFPYPG